MTWSRPAVALAVGASLALVAGLIGPLPAQAAESWRLGGSGFGHGVGMSQYGAYVQAAEGRSARAILEHYFRGSVVAGVTDSADIRVNLVHSAASFRTATVSLQDGGGTGSITVGGGSFAVRAGDVVTYSLSGGSITAERSGPSGAARLTGASAQVVWSGTRARSGPATLLDVAGPGETLGDASGRYRWGTLDVRVVAGRLEAVNIVRLHDEYLYGIAEMPSSWPAAALQAQVVAARSFALVRLAAGPRAACACHVYDTTADQVFAGWAKEGEPTWGARWTAAVDATHTSATTGLALLSGGRVVQAFYSSSSGGRTQANEDVWGGTPLAHLRSVPDPWSLDDRNPYRRWVRDRTNAQLAAAFGLPDVVRLDLSARTGGGGVRTARATASTGATATVTGERLRTALSLPSTSIRHQGRRLSGADRYATAAAVARAVHPSATTVVVVGGEDAHLVDGLVAGPLTAALAAPLLLAGGAGLPPATVGELDRRGSAVRSAVVVGGPAAVPEAVVDRLRARGLVVERISGADRYATAAAVARAVRSRAGSARTEVLLASGAATSLVDALAAAGPAGATRRPVLLTGPTRLPDPTRSALDAVGATSVTVVGGTAAVPDAVAAQTGRTVRRLAGADRYATAATVAAAFGGSVPRSEVVVVAGDGPTVVDALAAGSLQRLTLLVRRDTVTEPALRRLQSTGALELVTVVGGDGVLLPAVHRALTEA